MKLRKVMAVCAVAVCVGGVVGFVSPADAQASGLRTEKFASGQIAERWSGSIRTRETGLFTFILTGSQSVLKVDGIKVVDEYQDPRYDRTGRLQLVANTKYDFELSVLGSTPGNPATSPGLEWSGPSFGRKIIPWNDSTLTKDRSPERGLSVGSSLRELAAARGIMIGTSVVQEPLDQPGNPYRDILRREFSMAPPEYAFLNTYPSFEGERERYGVPLVEQPNRLVYNAVVNDQKIQGAHLLWFEIGTFTFQQWLQGLSAEKRDAFVKSHIEEVMWRYGYQRQVESWNVLNEAFDGEGKLRGETLDAFYGGQKNWLAIDEEYIVKVFRWAREADPEALLFYNENNIEDDDGNGGSNGRKWSSVLRLVTRLKNEGLIDGVGFQGHLSIGKPINQGQFDDHLRQLNDLGVKARITELDVLVSDLDAPEAEKQKLQAYGFAKMVGSCLHSANCDAVVIWGLSDNESWLQTPNPLDKNRGPQARATIFDSNYQKKDAYWGINFKLRGQ